MTGCSGCSGETHWTGGGGHSWLRCPLRARPHLGGGSPQLWGRRRKGGGRGRVGDGQWYGWWQWRRVDWRAPLQRWGCAGKHCRWM